MLETKNWTTEGKLSVLALELEFGFQHAVWIYLGRPWKGILLIFAVWDKWGGKDKWLEMAINFSEEGIVK